MRATMFIAVWTTLAVSGAAGAGPVNTESVKTKAALTGAMRSNFAALMTLQPYLISQSRFEDPKNADEIRHQIEILERTPHAIPGNGGNQEPGLSAITHLFSGYLSDVRHRFNQGDREHARRQLRTATSFCFACHARVGAEKDFEDMEKQVATLGASDLERADLYAATRQFEPAMVLYAQILRGKVKDETGYFNWSHAARNALRISIRVRNDPEATLKLLASLESRTDLPPFLRDYVTGWRRDVLAWKSDPTDPAKLSSEELVRKAQDLIGHIDSILMNDLSDVPLLRATRYLHEALTREPAGRHRPEALFLLGLAYRGPQDPLLWELDGLYFEACIRENPRTAIAKRCFKRLQNDIYFGYTGSSGTHVPVYESNRLGTLRKLAF